MSGCTENRAYNPNESTSDYTSLCAKEKTEENRIYFNYPQFKETVTNASKLNELIIGFVESVLAKACDGGFKGNIKDLYEKWEWNNNEYTLQAMDISYKIKRSDSDYFSVTFEGLHNYKTAAHPINYFNSLIIDLKNCELVTLSDLYNIDTDFANLIKNKFKEQIREGLAEKTGVPINEIPEFVEDSLLSLSDETLLEAIHQTDKNSDFGFHSFMTNSALGISVPISYIMSDHFEIYINFEELKEYTKSVPPGV